MTALRLALVLALLPACGDDDDDDDDDDFTGDDGGVEPPSCECPAGSLLCDDRCVDPDADTRHCGGCGVECPAGRVCFRGECADTVACLDDLGLDGVVELELGLAHSCARKDDGTVWCWGYNEFGQLGDGTRENRDQPVQVVGLEGAVELAVGEGLGCARLDSAEVWCWGGNDGHGEPLAAPMAW